MLECCSPRLDQLIPQSEAFLEPQRPCGKQRNTMSNSVPQTTQQTYSSMLTSPTVKARSSELVQNHFLYCFIQADRHVNS